MHFIIIVDFPNSIIASKMIEINSNLLKFEGWRFIIVINYIRVAESRLILYFIQECYQISVFVGRRQFFPL
jgi:hypothetical protein